MQVIANLIISQSALFNGENMNWVLVLQGRLDDMGILGLPPWLGPAISAISLVGIAAILWWITRAEYAGKSRVST